MIVPRRHHVKGVLLFYLVNPGCSTVRDTVCKAMRNYDNFINGKFVPSTGRERITCINPSDRAGDLHRAGEHSSGRRGGDRGGHGSAESCGRERPAVKRAEALRAIAAKIREQCGAAGAPHHRGAGQDARTWRAWKWRSPRTIWTTWPNGRAASRARFWKATGRARRFFLFRQPIGVIGGILPWNFPFFLIARKAAPALVTGNTIVIKPSEETPHNAVKFCELMAQTDLPPGVINVVHGRGAGAGKALAPSPKIGMISFTGSVETGSAIMAAAAPNITKVNLELGGKAPAIVMARRRSRAGGKCGQGVARDQQRAGVQLRGAGLRAAEVADQFTEKLTTAMEATRFGNPLADHSVDYGPLINQAGYNKVESLVRGAVAAGATLVTGGARHELEGGYYYQPTVLADCRQDMEIVRKEIFGPVIPVVKFDDLDQAIAFANDSDYGLTSSIYTRDLNTALRACQEIRFGETYINRENFEAMQGFHAGVRKSGIGGADGKHGLYEFTQTHVVYMQRG